MEAFTHWEKVVYAGLNSDDAFRKALRNAMEKLRIDAKHLSRLSGVSESSLYKTLSGQRESLRLSSYRGIVKALKKIEGVEEGDPFIAIIAARPILDTIERKYVEVRGRRVQLKEYAATSIEDVIIASVRAQQEGAKAIVCAPIVSTTVEKITRIPVSACPVTLCAQPIMKAAEMAASKMFME